MVKVFKKKMTSLTLILVFGLSLVAAFNVATVSPTNVAPESSADPSLPSAAASTPLLADEDTIVDPRGQTVKQDQQLELGRDITLDVIQPIDWALDVKGYEIMSVNVPIDVDLNFGVTFPVNSEVMYNPYDVHAGETFDYSVSINNDDCTPYATVGVDVEAALSELDFSVGNIANLLEFAVGFDDISYHNSWDIPFYGTSTKLGNWLSYDIVDKYWTLEDLIHVNTEKFGVGGGVGINLNYEIYSYVTAAVNVDGAGSTTTTDLRWDDFGRKDIEVAVDPSAVHGELFNVTIGDWVYHIAHDLTLTVWADVKLEVIGIKLLDQTFDWGYTLPLGELAFPEKDDFTFESQPQVLAGKSVKNVEASYSVASLGWNSGSGLDFQALNYEAAVPNNSELQKWFDDMDVEAGVEANVTIDFPYNQVSYYNERKVTAGSSFDYNILMDSIATDAPGVNYGVGAYLDLSSQSIFGYQLDKYEFDVSGNIWTPDDDLVTPFGEDFIDYDITKLVKLDKASKMLNDKISEMCYGINPDIQFTASIVLKLEGYMTADVSIVNDLNGIATITSATDTTWNEQYDTQTTRIEIDESANQGDTFDVKYSNIVYHLTIVPGLKVGVSVLGGIIGFDFTIFLPDSWFPQISVFNGPDFVETIEVQELDQSVTNVVVADSSIQNGEQISGSFQVNNIGTTSDRYILGIEGMPVGTTGVLNYGGKNHELGDWTDTILPSGAQTVSYVLTPGPGAHTQEGQVMNSLQFKATSISKGTEYALSAPYAITFEFDPLAATSTAYLSYSVSSCDGLVNNKAAVLKGNVLVFDIKITNFDDAALSGLVSAGAVSTGYVGSKVVGTNAFNLAAGGSSSTTLTLDTDATIAAGYYVATVTNSKGAPLSVPFYVVDSLSNTIAFAKNPLGAEYVFEAKTESEVSVVPGVDINVPVKITNYGTKNGAYGISLVADSPEQSWVTLGTTSIGAVVGTSSEVAVTVAVPKESTSLAGDYSYSIVVKDLNSLVEQTLPVTVSVAEFKEVSVAIAYNGLSILAEPEVDMGEFADYTFELTNEGNTAQIFTVAATSEAGVDVLVAGSANVKSITVAPGVSQLVAVSLDYSDSLPGIHTFNVEVNQSDQTLFTQEFDVKVMQLEVDISADTYTLENEDVVYTVYMTNKASTQDTFTVSISGLPEGVYTLSKSTVNIAGGGIGSFDVIVDADYVKTMAAGWTGFNVIVNSALTSTTFDESHSAIYISEVYSANLVTASPVENDEFVEYFLTVTNDGNLDQTFDIEISGVDGLTYEIYEQGVLTTSVLAGNQLSLTMGESTTIVVRVYKTGNGGDFEPTINIVNANGDVIATYTNELSFGFTQSLMIIIIIAAVATIAVVGGVFGALKMKDAGKFDGLREKAESAKSRREAEKTLNSKAKDAETKKVKAPKAEMLSIDESVRRMENIAILEHTYILRGECEELIANFEAAKGRKPKSNELEALVVNFIHKRDNKKAFEGEDNGW